MDQLLFDLDSRERILLRNSAEFKEAIKLSSQSESIPGSDSRATLVLREMFRLNQSILEENELGETLRRIVDAAMELTHARRGVLVVRQRGRLRFLAARSAGRDLDSPDEQVSRTLIERTFEEGVGRISTDARQDVTLDSIASVEELGLRSVICVPMAAKGGKRLGVLYLDNSFEEGVFASDDLELVESFCSQAALAWNSAHRREEIKSLVEELRVANERLEGELLVSRREAARRLGDDGKLLDGIVGASPRMRQLFEVVQVVAPTDIPVLITGESGCGKELVARALHRMSDRTDQPFIAENCGAVPDTLLESTLFGHTKGAFTGAEKDRAGLFELANGGTLFLDEIAELPADMQTRLLRVLQEGEVRPVGGQKVLRVKVRVIAATNRDVHEAIESGRFRRDLYYRLQGAEIDVPTLRDRAEDIPLLVEHFLGRQAGDGQTKTVTPEALKRLVRYPWPGNVRELENEVRRLALMCPASVIGPEYLSPAIWEGRASVGSQSTNVPDEVRPLRSIEQEAILNAMKSFGNHRGKVAKALGVSRSTLYLKLKEMGYGDDGK